MVEMRRQLESVEPGAFGGLLRYLDEGRRHYELAMPNLVERDFRRATDFFRPASLPLMLRLHALSRHYAHMRAFAARPGCVRR